MRAQYPSSSGRKNSTLLNSETSTTTKPPRPFVAIAVVGAALITYQIHKTPDARLRLECLADQAHRMGDLSSRDAAIVADLLGQPAVTTPFNEEQRYVF